MSLFVYFWLSKNFQIWLFQGSPTRGVGLEEEGRKSDRKKKKFNMPSFGKKDKK